jgi:hypothetical protein
MALLRKDELPDDRCSVAIFEGSPAQRKGIASAIDDAGLPVAVANDPSAFVAYFQVLHLQLRDHSTCW